ncbi:MAG: ATP-binding protein [Anaerolineae bacterium]|nr:ATP-binding protein [Anaerolineae bacterium]
MSETKKQFQIHLPGLLKVLAESLYSSKKVGIRELIQNAHDSCIRRRVETKDNYYKPRVDITFDHTARKIIISDNGSGLTEDEVTEYLSTIGRSYTRNLGENLAILSPDEASQLIGQFGLGFLSAFLIADEVTLITKSYKDEPAVRWRSSGDVHYDVTELEEEVPIGTRVELAVKPEASFLLNERVMIDTVHQYADFLDIPVHVSGGAVVNATMPPWASVDPDLAMKEYVNRTFGHMNPLAIIPLHDQEISLGHDSVTVPMEGFLFIPPGTMASIQEYGDVNIYIRGMFIMEKHTRLLPSWAKFVRGVIDCPYLQPTASREDIQQDDMFFKVQKAIEEQLAQGLKRISEEDPQTWKRIILGHRYLIMSWSLKDDAFFREIMDMVTFRTPQGHKNLKEYTDGTDYTVYYITRELGSQQDQLLGAGYGVNVIDASGTIEPIFLKKYAHMNPRIKLVQMDGDSNQLLQSVPEEDYLSILDYYRQRGIRARIVSFKPEDVPAIVNYPKDAEFIKETRDALDKGDLPGPFAGLVGDYVKRMDIDEDMLAGTLHINAACDLVQNLGKYEQSEARDAALELMYQMARLFAGRMLDTADVTHAFKISATSIQNLLGDGGSRDE